MARPTPALVAALRETARRLRAGAPYSWSLLGSCNCGHLAQTITRLTSVQIQARALESAGDWTEQARAYCPASGVPMEDVFAEMMRIGLTRADIARLEKLSDPAVLARLPADDLPLRHNRRDDVVRYLTAWAGALEEALPSRRPSRTRDQPALSAPVSSANAAIRRRRRSTTSG